jgi:hypothetical protein
MAINSDGSGAFLGFPRLEACFFTIGKRLRGEQRSPLERPGDLPRSFGRNSRSANRRNDYRKGLSNTALEQDYPEQPSNQTTDILNLWPACKVL